MCKMNMRLPRYLVDSDPLLTNVTVLTADGTQMDVSETEWTAEELENAESQVEAVLMEDALIQACFEEMMEEEEDRWFHNHVATTQAPFPQFTAPSHTPLPQFTSSTATQMPVMLSISSQLEPVHSNAVPYYNTYNFETSYHFEQKYYMISRLNPEAPEFVPRGMTS